MDKDEKLFRYIMESTRILRFPKHSLATFGVTNIYYYLLAELKTDKMKLREGRIISERPQILFPRQPENIFEGFSEEARQYSQLLFREFGSDVRILQYKFRNEFKKVSVHPGPLDTAITKINERIDRAQQDPATIIKGIDNVWQVSLMKFIIEMTIKSFYDNITELKERGFFETEGGIPKPVRSQIERLFEQAKKDKSKIDQLGEKLSRFGLFEEYEDRFFSLFKKKKM